MGRSHRRMSSLKLSGSPRIDRATSSSSVHVMRSAERSLSQSVRRWTAAVWPGPLADFVQYIVKGPKSFPCCRLRLTPLRSPGLSPSWRWRSFAVQSRHCRLHGPRPALMPRATRPRRLTRPATGGAAPAKGPAGADTAAQPLVSLLARTSRLIDLLPPLPQHATDVTGGGCSLLFEFNPGT